MLNKILLTISISGLLMLSGCSTIPTVALSDYPDDHTATMPQVAKLPANIDNQDRLKVVVLDSVDDSVRGGRQAKLGESLTREIEALLGKNGVEVIDRSLATKLDQEIKLCEMQGKKCGSSIGPSVAKYAIKATINRAEYGSSYVPTSSWTDKKGKTYVTPAHYQHSASAGVSLKVYEMPSLREVKAIVGSDTESQQTSQNDNLGASMIRASLQHSVSTGQAKADLLNIFAPKGYVIGKRVPKGGGKPIFKVSIGSTNGLVPGAPVVIMTEQETINPITQKSSIELIDVAKTLTSNLVSPNEAWVVPDDADKAKQVRLGDQALVQHEKRMVFLEKLEQSLNK